MAPKLYTSTEAREILRVGKTRMNDMLVSGELPSFKVGQRRRVAEDDLKAYLDRLKSAGARAESVAA